ncbi:MAG: SDR family NAD(P)-dependent oxidoreductase [Bacilli bacterium]|nr:SDR family NAD(P)-dependent oxidoreductase [Bacilli bacterium]
MSRCILITGATGAIGGALAYEYAMLDVVLLLQGRNEKRLEELAKICRDQGATVVTHVVDLRDQTALFAWIKEISSYPLDLVIVNAGMNTHIGAHGEAEPWRDVEAILDINLKAAIAITQGVLPSMREKKKGQIALVSSLAAYFGLPVTPTYCASKAGLKAYGEALRGWLGPEGIKINVIMPGYIQSPMCDEMPGPKPFLCTPKHAAKAIRKGLKKDKARISFPFPLNFGTWWLAVLPASLSGRIVAWLGYRG